MDETSNPRSASNRIDLPHTPPDVEVGPPPAVRRRRRRVEPVAACIPAPAEVPYFIAEPPEAVPEIVVHHADDIALHLAERLREVERRELAALEYETKLQEAEAAARVWVCQRDLELSALERELHLKSGELNTQVAAIAAAEIAAEEERKLQHSALHERERELERQAAELVEREERLHGERGALDQALDKLRAQRRRDEELQRAQQQKWQTLFEGDRHQAERTLANLLKHRQSLDERERALIARENRQAALSRGDNLARTSSDRKSCNLELSVLRTEATRDHRLALEHRWVAGQLWARLASSGLASDDELQESLERVRGQLELMYRREREALEDLRASLAETVRHLKLTPREIQSRRTPRSLAFTG